MDGLGEVKLKWEYQMGRGRRLNTERDAETKDHLRGCKET